MMILIAEDDFVSRNDLKEAVEKLGHRTLVAKDGLEAWELYQNSSEIDVVISGWDIQGLDGSELCRRARRIDRVGYTFFIFLSESDSEEQLVTGIKAGFDDYLTKPLNSEQLRARLLVASRLTSLHRHPDGNGNGGATPAGSSIEIDPSDKGATNGALIRSGGALTSKRSDNIGGAKLWDILVAEGKLSREQVRRAMEAQKSDPRDLGKILVSLGFISASELARAQARRLRLNYIELSEKDVDRDVVALVPERLLRRHRVVPLRIDRTRWLVVAMSDPTDIHAIEDLRMASGYEVIPVVATEEDIRRTQTRIFAVGEQVAKILQEASGGVEDRSELDLGIEAKPNEKPVIRLASSILQQAIGHGASDIHIEPRAQELTVRFRVDGVLRKVMSIPPKLQGGVIARFKLLGNLDIAEHRVPQDGRFSVKLAGQNVDLRVASLPAVHGEKIVLRLLDTASVEADLTKLGFSPGVLERYEAIFRRPYGTILVTGPTGSGKSTTLYATLGELSSPENNIVTVEDPVEYRMQDITQMQVNPRAGLTFASALKSILRADPDIVMIGEVRDYETAKIAIESALTGHLVLATLHTNDAPSAMGRLTDMGIEPFLISSAVDCVIAQRLARKLCERCKEQVELEEEILAGIDFPFDLAPEGGFRFQRAVGCSRCGGSGYKGRVGIFELLTVTDDIREMIVRRASNNEIGRAAREGGMMRLRQDGLLKAAQGLTTIEEVLRTVL